MKKISKILCFDKNTLVATKTGDTLITKIKPGMEILAFEEQTLSYGADVVTATAKSKHDQCAIIRFDDGTSLKATIDHPLFVNGKGWCAVNVDGLEKKYGVTVRQLEEGDLCLSLKNNIMSNSRVVSIEVKPCSEFFYCLATKNNHSFLANGVVAHDVDIKRFSDEQLTNEGVIVEHAE